MLSDLLAAERDWRGPRRTAGEGRAPESPERRAARDHDGRTRCALKTGALTGLWVRIPPLLPRGSEGATAGGMESLKGWRGGAVTPSRESERSLSGDRS